MISTSCGSEVSTTRVNDRMQASNTPLKALIFDVDGTLYEKGRVRRAILFRLVRAYLASPREGLLTLRVLDAYRKAQEVLRKSPSASVDIAAAQLKLAGHSLGL